MHAHSPPSQAPVSAVPCLKKLSSMHLIFTPSLGLANAMGPPAVSQKDEEGSRDALVVDGPASGGSARTCV